MKKKFLFFAILVLFPISLFAQYAEIESKQVLVPKEIFVGDFAELQYTFQSSIDFYSIAGADKIKNGVVVLDCSEKDFGLKESECSIKKVILKRVGITYTLVIYFIPWKPGTINFCLFDLISLCSAKDQSSVFMVDLRSEEIASICEKMNVFSVRPPAAPLLLPGTTYVVWSCIIVLIMFFVLLGVIIAKFSSILNTVLTVKENFGYLRNARMTTRRLSYLLRKKCSDIQFAEQWQKIMRTYLEYRFGTSFSSVTANNIFSTVTYITGNMLEIEQENAVLSLASLFTRTDYIRFACGSIESHILPAAEHEAMFAYGERKNIVDLTNVDIADLEAKL